MITSQTKKSDEVDGSEDKLESGSISELFSVSEENFLSPLTMLATDQDHAQQQINRNPQHLTERLHELVPLLKIVGFQLESVVEREVVGVVPLLASAINQNGTHQASLFNMMSDYIAGVTIWSALIETYTVGVHDRCKGQPVQFWLKSNRVQHLRPGTGLLRGRARMEDDVVTIMRDRVLSKRRCEVPLRVNIFQGETLIATADPVMGVYVDNPRMPNLGVVLERTYVAHTQQ